MITGCAHYPPRAPAGAAPGRQRPSQTPPPPSRWAEFDMPSIGKKQGELLTLSTAPEVAVHGPCAESLQDILENGLSRMQKRHHVALAKALRGETGVASVHGKAELFIWVNVREAIQGGLVFYVSADGALLCSGRSGDGLIPPKFISVAIELRDGLSLKPAQVRQCNPA